MRRSYANDDDDVEHNRKICKYPRRTVMLPLLYTRRRRGTTRRVFYIVNRARAYDIKRGAKRNIFDTDKNYCTNDYKRL